MLVVNNTFFTRVISKGEIIMKTEKGAGGPTEVDGEKVAGNFLAHQIPLKNAKTDEKQLKILENWLKSYDWRPE